MSFFLSNQNAQPVLVRDLRPGDVATLDPRPGYGLQIAGFAPCRRSGVRRVLFAGEAHTLRCNRVGAFQETSRGPSRTTQSGPSPNMTNGFRNNR